ncbi:MAG: hypothetical protein AAGA87_12715 [Pseudomonadota bacterium]
MTRKTADLWLTIALGAVFAAAGIRAAFLSWQAAVLPILLAICGTILMAALLIAAARGQQHVKDGPLFKGDEPLYLGLFLAAILSVLLLGFEIGGFVFVAAYLRFAGGFGVIKALLLAPLAPILSRLAFTHLLGQPGFPGLLF